MKKYIKKSVLKAAEERIKFTFDNFEKIYLSFSGGKDSTVMLHLAMEEAKKRNRKIGVLIVDLEAQYKLTMDHIQNCVDMYKEYIELYWICLPLSLRNAVSVYEPRWICWDKDEELNWVRPMPKNSISDESFFPFFKKGMEFEELVPLFGLWYSGGVNTACLVGIRADESLNRFRTIINQRKVKFKNAPFTTEVEQNLFNVYPVYDWASKDIWIYTKKMNKPMNEVYQRMYMAKVPVGDMRICQPYGDDQRKGLWLYHLLEPTTWNKVINRVSGVNSGSLYAQDRGNINGVGRITKPKGHTYKSYCELLLVSMPKTLKSHYLEKFNKFIEWWKDRDYPDGIPDEAPYELESLRIVPSYRRLAKVLLRNDYWCKGLSFTQPKSDAYKKFVKMKKEEKSIKN